MMMVITPEQFLPNEAEIINELFNEGLTFLHVRKPLATANETFKFIEKIAVQFRSRLVLHQHYDEGDKFGISRIHIKENDRKNGLHQSFKRQILSTSVHQIEVFNELDETWKYAFISPVFQSISKKDYGEDSTVLEELKKRKNSKVKLIALGGITENNIQEILNKNVDGVALLGAIWENREPLKAFKKCMKNVPSF